MRLLFDQNLAPRLVTLLAEAFPGSLHVREVGLEAADDRRVWDFARGNGLAIVSKDADFRQLSFLHGSPPKVIWLRVGNRSTVQIAEVVRAHLEEIAEFAADEVAALLVIP